MGRFETCPYVLSPVKETIAQHPERVGDRIISAAFPVALPLWMDVPSAEAPAFAGMTGVVQRCRRGGRVVRRRRFGTSAMDWNRVL